MGIVKRDWVTNDPELAKQLRAADRKFDAAVLATRNLPLMKKVEALRQARETLRKDYDAVMA